MHKDALRSSLERVWSIFLCMLVGVASGALMPAEAVAQPVDLGVGSEDGIEIDVRGSARRVLLPMAVPDALEAEETGEVAERVAQILRRDFTMSGFFKVLPPSSFFFDPSVEGMRASEVNFQNWFQVGAQGLVKSAVRVTGEDVRLDLRLYAVDTGEEVELSWKPKPASRDDYEQQVHAFVNAVIEHFTGQPGVFGTRVVYARRLKDGSKQIFVSQIDGSRERAITDNRSINMLPSWAGGAIYYTSYRASNPDLWVYRGGKHVKISSQRGQNTGAAYCGGKLAVTLSMGGENADIYVIDAQNGEVLDRLTKHWAIDTSPTWSPDCSRIAFVSGRSGGPQIHVMEVDGGEVKRLTFRGDYNTQPAWSPTGETIAFAARDERNAYDVFTVDLEGNIRRLTQDQGNNEHPSYSPDGRYLVFVSDRGGKGDRVWMMTADGEIQHPVSRESGGYASPMWEP